MKPRFYLFLARYAFPSLVLWDVLVILMFLWDAPSISGWSVVWLFLLYAILCILLPCAASYLWLRRHHEKCFHLGTMKKQCYLHLEKYSSIGRLLLTGGLFLLPYPTKTALLLPLALLLSLYLSHSCTKWWSNRYFTWNQKMHFITLFTFRETPGKQADRHKKSHPAPWQGSLLE